MRKGNTENLPARNMEQKAGSKPATPPLPEGNTPHAQAERGAFNPSPSLGKRWKTGGQTQKNLAKLSTFPFFDKQDISLVQMVNSVTSLPPGDASLTPLSNLFDPALHPNGIKRLAVSREERIAYAVVNLLESLEEGSREKRLEALSTLHDEVLYSAVTQFRTNTGRVLIQIMKRLVRSKGNLPVQQKLAHDFRLASSGNPRIIRKLLTKYNLLEMPENGSQITFDNHVHDSHTKGRKSPTHLIMDAWVKGIRALTVVYYNHVEAGAARELLEAARIMGIHVRIGIEFNCTFHGRRAKFIWAPYNLSSTQEFVDFLKKPQMEHLMQEGYAVSLFREEIIFELLVNFNQNHLAEISREYDIALSPLDRDEFDRFVARGQASRLHLAEFIFRKMQPLLQQRSLELWEERSKAAPERVKAIDALLLKMNTLDPETIQYGPLAPGANPNVPDPDNPPWNMPMPALMHRDVVSMVRWVYDLHPTSDIVLTLTNLRVEDVLEILYDCEGLISHVELFNYKDYMLGRSPQIRRINRLQNAINDGRVLAIKRTLRRIIRQMRAEPEPEHDPHGGQNTRSARSDQEFRLDKFERILRNIPRLVGFYASHPLGSRLGSDSTGRSRRFFGMGLAFIKTLPARSRKAIAERRGLHLVLPVHSLVFRRVEYLPRQYYGWMGKRMSLALAKIPGLAWLAYRKRVRWVVRSNATQFTVQGNVITLGSTGGDNAQVHFPPLPASKLPSKRALGLFYLNTPIKNVLKVLTGLAVATLTFMYTQNWWLLMFFGGAIWLGITSLRNIVQSVLGGGGLRRPSTLHWRDYVNWTRVADSLFYTGFSVPLLELLVRVLFLQDALGVNADSHPVLAYTVMSLVNGFYITSHNLYRGLPREAAIGNMFRSVLAIPTAVLFSAMFYNSMLLLAGIEPGKAELVIIATASVISKLSSDTVAAIIEGLADRASNRRSRQFDYNYKLKQLFDTFTELELSFPHQDVLEILRDPKIILGWASDAGGCVPNAEPGVVAAKEPGTPETGGTGTIAGRVPPGKRSAGWSGASANAGEILRFERTIIINALDLMYFWYYQPRARDVLKNLLRRMTLEERTIFMRCQAVLSREHEISLLVVDGMLGRNFSKALAFYLDRWQNYLTAMQELTRVK